MIERRREDRWTERSGSAVAVDGFTGRLQDLSADGARIATNKNFEMDTVVRLDLSWGMPIRASVIESQNGQLRLRFDNPIDPLI